MKSLVVSGASEDKAISVRVEGEDTAPLLCYTRMQ